MTAPRIFCCVAGCRRSWKDDGKFGEIICARHYKMASVSLRNRFKRIKATIRARQRRLSSEPSELRRLQAIENRCWRRIVAAASGIGSLADVSGIERELQELGL